MGFLSPGARFMECCDGQRPGLAKEVGIPRLVSDEGHGIERDDGRTRAGCCDF